MKYKVHKASEILKNALLVTTKASKIECLYKANTSHPPHQKLPHLPILSIPVSKAAPISTKSNS